MNKIEAQVFGKAQSWVSDCESYYDEVHEGIKIVTQTVEEDMNQIGEIKLREYVDFLMIVSEDLDTIMKTKLKEKVYNRSLSYNSVDVTELLHSMMDDAAMEFKFYSQPAFIYSSVNGRLEPTENYDFPKLKKFISLVETNARYDLKNQPEWQHDYYVYEGQVIGRDGPGNIVFGYLAKVFGYSEEFASFGAGFYQILSGTSSWEFAGSWFDDPRDQAMIQLGYEYYDRTH